MKNPSYDYIDILADFPPNSVGHEFKHAIENYQAALSGIKGSVDDALFANPRLQALMKDNIVSEDEFVASMVKRYLYLKPNEEINTMSRIVTQDKLNELTGKNIDYGKGGGIVLTTKP